MINWSSPIPILLKMQLTGKGPQHSPVHQSTLHIYPPAVSVHSSFCGAARIISTIPAAPFETETECHEANCTGQNLGFRNDASSSHDRVRRCLWVGACRFGSVSRAHLLVFTFAQRCLASCCVRRIRRGFTTSYLHSFEQFEFFLWVLAENIALDRLAGQTRSAPKRASRADPSFVTWVFLR
jgi:hypothetical protein